MEGRNNLGQFVKGCKIGVNHEFGKVFKGNKLRLGLSPWNKGTHVQTNDALKKYYESGKHPFRGTKGLLKPNSGSFQKGHKRTPSGEQHWRWKKDKNNLRKIIQELEQYTNWRMSVFRRDSFKCKNCGATRDLIADHIKPFSEIILENKITNFQEAINCSELWDVNNGNTLCKDCHFLTDTYGSKQMKRLKEKQLV